MYGSSIEILIFGFSFKLWEVFAVISVFLCALEVFAPGFILLPIGLAFGLAAVPAAFVGNWVLVLLSLGLSLFIMVYLFMNKIKASNNSSSKLTNVDGLVGKTLKVTKAFAGDESLQEFGEAKLYGDIWTVYSSKSSTNFRVGQNIKVIKVNGNKLEVDTFE